MEALIEQAKEKLPEGWTMRVYLEPSFGYVFITRADGSTWNIDMHQRITISEQLRIAVESLPPKGETA